MPWNPKYELRDYQRQACRDTVTAFTRGVTGAGPFEKLLLIAATGAGKTIMASALAHWATSKGKKVLFLADSDELVAQAVEKIHRSTGIVPDIEKAHRRASLEAPVVVGSIQTLSNRARLERYAPDHFGLVIADEAHLSMAEGWQRVLNYFPGNFILGITATPTRFDKKCLMEFYEHVSAEITLWDLIERQHLSPITVQTAPIEVDVPEGDDDDEQVLLEEALGPYWDAIIDAWQQYASDRPTLFFHPSIRASHHFTGLLQKRGISAVHVDGTTKDRHLPLRKFGDGKVQVLNNAQLLIKGYDEPRISCIVNLRKMGHEGTYKQAIGRGTRLFCPHGCPSWCDHPDRKQDLLILDLLWAYEGHNVMRPADLISTGEEAEEVTKQIRYATSPMKLGDIRDAVVNDMEKRTIDAMRKASKFRARKIDAREWGTMMGQPKLANFEPTARWHEEPVSEKQAEFLIKHKVDPATLGGRGHASAMMDAIMERLGGDKTTPKQVALLLDFGVEQPHKLDRRQASEILTQHGMSMPQRK